MKIKKGFLLREVDGTAIVVAVGAAAREFNGMITLNSVGAFLWREIDKGATESDLVAALLNEYEVEEAVAAKDVSAFVYKMREAGILDE